MTGVAVELAVAIVAVKAGALPEVIVAVEVVATVASAA